MPDEGCTYDRVIKINLTELALHIIGPFTLDLCTPVSGMRERVTEQGWLLEVFSYLIGSCTISSFEDMAKRTNLTKQALDAGLKFEVPLT